MKTFVIVNPASAAGRTGRLWPGIEARLKAAIGEFEAKLTSAPGQAVGLASEAQREGFGRIIAVGGDGTASEVLNGLFQDREAEYDWAKGGMQIKPASDIQMGIISSGTGGDFPRSTGLSGDLKGQIAAIAGGQIKRIDVGGINLTREDGIRHRHYFLNGASLGLSAEIAAGVNRGGTGKKAGGRFAFLISALKVLFKQKPLRIMIAFDGSRPEMITTALITVMNGRYAGGGFKLAPMAELDSGFLEAIVVGDVGLGDLVLNARRLYRGRHLSHPAIKHQRFIDLEASAIADARVGIEADGEVVGRLPARFDVFPRALDIFWPQEQE
ncbi:MAG: diacylglycerol kinase family protein [Sphingomonadales bacterium]